MSDCLEIWESQPPGILRACTGIGIPFHIISYEVTCSAYLYSLCVAKCRRASCFGGETLLYVTGVMEKAIADI
jgi:hypothetical protein